MTTAQERSWSNFDPTSIGLPKDFLLTDYTRLKGCSCKIPQASLLRLLCALNPDRPAGDVGMDCSIVPLRPHLTAAGTEGGRLFQVSTCDFFAPSVDDPYLQGCIGAANVLSDLYALGVIHCDSLLMILASSTDMEQEEAFTVTLQIMKGFCDTAMTVGVNVTGGQSIQNPWPLIGGTAMTVCTDGEIIRPEGLVVGDVLVLTKPLGAQLAVNLHQWRKRPTPLYKQHIEGYMSERDIDDLFHCASSQMARLNRNGAILMLKYGAHGCTDVTGFGLYGHASNLALAQQAVTGKEKMTIVVSTLPIYEGAVHAERLLNNKYKLFQGRAAETSGGLLVALPNENAAREYIEELQLMDPDHPTANIVGHVAAFDRSVDNDDQVRLVQSAKLIVPVPVSAFVNAPAHAPAAKAKTHHHRLPHP